MRKYEDETGEILTDDDLKRDIVWHNYLRIM